MRFFPRAFMGKISPLKVVLVASYRFWYIVSSFSFTSKQFLIPFYFFFDSLVKNMLLNFHLFEGFPIFFLLLISNFIPLSSENIFYIIVYGHKYSLSWRMFYMHLKRMYFMLLSEILYYMLGLVHFLCWSSIYYWCSI